MLVGCPFGIPHFANQLWFNPGYFTFMIHFFVKWPFIGFQHMEFCIQFLYAGIVKPGAAIAYVLYVFSRLNPQDQWPKMLAWTRWRGIPANNCLLWILQFKLKPAVWSFAAVIITVTVFANNTFPSFFFCFFKKSGSFTFYVIIVNNAGRINRR